PPRRARRDDTPAFNSSMWYTIRNVADLNYGLSSGQSMQPQGVVDTQAAGSLSSENWQLLYQSGKYFIRNWDYGVGWQFGLTSGNRSQPQLHQITTGGRALQWTVTKVDNGWQLANGLLGSDTIMVLNPTGALPLMQLGATNGVWNITQNPSALESKPLTGTWTSPVSDFETVTPTPSATASSSLAASVVTVSTTLSSTPSISPSTTGTTQPITNSSSSSLSTGAIAGIVLGALLLLLGALLVVYFFIIKKKKQRKHGNPYEVHGDTAAPASEKYAY
ncbi:hypothetical protein EK21DRAFT_37517, partial [Setomelanomma holmii]